MRLLLFISVCFIHMSCSKLKMNEYGAEKEPPAFRFLPSSSTGVTFNNYVDENIKNHCGG